MACVYSICVQNRTSNLTYEISFRPDGDYRHPAPHRRTRTTRTCPVSDRLAVTSPVQKSLYFRFYDIAAVAVFETKVKSNAAGPSVPIIYYHLPESTLVFFAAGRVIVFAPGTQYYDVDPPQRVRGSVNTRTYTADDISLLHTSAMCTCCATRKHMSEPKAIRERTEGDPCFCDKTASGACARTIRERRFTTARVRAHNDRPYTAHRVHGYLSGAYPVPGVGRAAVRTGAVSRPSRRRACTLPASSPRTGQ